MAALKPGQLPSLSDYMNYINYTKQWQENKALHMTKNDYEKVANAIVAMCDPIRSALSAHGGAPTRQIIEIIAAQLGLMFAAENRDFDSFRFMEALNKKLRTKL